MLSYTKHVLWQRGSHKSMVLNTRKFYSWSPSHFCSFPTCSCNSIAWTPFRWMFRMSFLMRILQNNFIWSLFHIIRFFVIAEHFIGSNRLPKPNLPNSEVSLHGLDLFHSYDSALFIYHTDIGIILLLPYVDDIIITIDHTHGIRTLQTLLSQQFEMQYLDTLSCFLGLKVSSSSNDNFLSHAKYAYDLL